MDGARTQNREGRLPLTCQQQFYRDVTRPRDRLNKLDSVFAVRLVGPLNLGVLRQCFEAVIARHQSLRATISVDDGDSWQYFNDPGGYELNVIDLSDPPALESGTISRLVADFQCRACDLEKGPLFDCQVVKCPNGEHLLIWGIHHLISDGTSLNLLFREIWHLYREFLGGRPSPLQALANQFSDYYAWQRSEDLLWLQRHQRHWNRHLAGAVGIQWPPARAADTTPSNKLTRVQISFPPALSVALRELAKRTRSFVSFEMLAVYSHAVSTWCEQDDFVLQLATNGRERLEHSDIVGFLAHFMFMRMQKTGRETFIDMLARVTREYFECLTRKDFGRMTLQRADLAAGTYFQWLTWGQDAISGVPTPMESQALSIAGERLALTEIIGNRPEDFRLYTMMWDTPDGIRGWVDCGISSYSSATIKQFIDLLQSTAQRIVENPHALVTRERGI